MTEPRTNVTDPFNDQHDFMTFGDQTVGIPNHTQQALYVELIKEEFKEFIDAVENNEPIANQIKEANDIIVVVLGWLHSTVKDAYKSWRLVHKNNMLKVVNPPVKDPVTSKIQKSPEAIAGKVIMMTGLEALIDPEPPELI